MSLKIIISLIIFIIIVYLSGGPDGAAAVASYSKNPFADIDEAEIKRVDREILSEYFDGVDFKDYKILNSNHMYYVYTYVEPNMLTNSRYFTSNKVHKLEDIVNSKFRAYYNDNYATFLYPGVDYKNHIYVHLTKGIGRAYVERRY